MLNPAEKTFFEILQKIIPDDYVVYPQIRLNSILEVQASKKDFWTYQNKINRKTVDFVIFDKANLQAVLVLEYDGKTHQKEERQDRDNFVDSILQSADLKILHVKHQKNLDLDALKSSVLQALLGDTEEEISGGIN